MYQQILLLFLLFIGHSTFAKITNVYIDLKPAEIEIGKYKDKNFAKQKIASYQKRNIDLNLIQSALLADKDEKVLFYLHSMMGGVQPYHKNSLKKLSQLNGVDKIISIVWHADKLFYQESWKLAVEQGYELVELINTLASDEEKEYHMLCHSMGHRLFEGMAIRWDTNKLHFKNIILAASDLEVDIFENELKDLPKATDRIIIYTNENDRLLKASTQRLKRERLGKVGHHYMEALGQVEKLELVNVSESVGVKKIRFTNHIYFKNHPMVLADIGRVINGQEEERLPFFLEKENNYGLLK